MGSLIKELLRLPLDVCFGSLADIATCLSNVRFTPNSGHQLASIQCPNGRKRTAAEAQLPEEAPPETPFRLGFPRK